LDPSRFETVGTIDARLCAIDYITKLFENVTKKFSRDAPHVTEIQASRTGRRRATHNGSNDAIRPKERPYAVLFA
jgi:hypothetical protein